MKTRNLLITFGVAAIAAITFNSAGALLSPRATGNQIRTAPAALATQQPATENQSARVSPRALGNRANTVAGVANDVNPAIACRKMTASPKAIQACAANPKAAMTCCTKSVAAAE